MPEGAAIRQTAATLLPLSLLDVSLVIAGQRLIDDISVTISRPGITVIMGPNGAGKSLLLRLVHGLTKPTFGQITWAGSSLTPSIRRRQAMVFQQPQLLRRTAGANIDFVLKLKGSADRQNREALLRRVGLEGRSDQPAHSMSGGEQQRLALARALALEPSVLLLDEATASLDPASQIIIEQIVSDAVTQNIKVLLVTHDIAQAKRLAHEVLFLKHGHVEEHTDAACFFERPTTLTARNFLEGKLVP